jgi:hypothetical protein
VDTRAHRRGEGGTHTLGADWVSHFERVPQSVPLAQRARRYQLATYAEFFGAESALVTGGTGVFLLYGRGLSGALPATIIGGLILSGLVLGVLQFLHGRIANESVLEAVRLYNTALNQTLPEPQQLDLGEFGAQPAEH